MKLGLDLAPLRVSAPYRRLYLSGLVTNLGSQATYVTVAYQMKEISHSPLAVGAIGLVELVPLIVFGLYGGVVADHFNRRRVIVSAEVALMCGAALLFMNALRSAPSSWVLYVVIVFTTMADGIQRPSLDAMNQQVVPHELQRSASTLNMMRYTLGAIVGPALGGLLSVGPGPHVVYAIDVVTFAVSLYFLVGVRAPQVASSTGRPSMSSLFDGVRYAVSRRDLLGTYLVDLAAMMLAFPITMLPFIAEHFSEPYALAVLYAATPFGAMLASATSGWTDRLHHYGRAIAVAAALWGVGIAVFGWSPVLWLAAVGLAFAGGADAVSAVLRGATWNLSIPPSVRGRMAGIELLSYSVGPTAGQFRAGAMTAAFGVRTSLTVGGLACAATCGALPAVLPAMWKFDVRTDANVAEVRRIRAEEGVAES